MPDTEGGFHIQQPSDNSGASQPAVLSTTSLILADSMTHGPTAAIHDPGKPFIYKVPSAPLFGFGRLAMDGFGFCYTRVESNYPQGVSLAPTQGAAHAWNEVLAAAKHREANTAGSLRRAVADRSQRRYLTLYGIDKQKATVLIDLLDVR